MSKTLVILAFLLLSGCAALDIGYEARSQRIEECSVKLIKLDLTAKEVKDLCNNAHIRDYYKEDKE